MDWAGLELDSIRLDGLDWNELGWIGLDWIGFRTGEQESALFALLFTHSLF